MVCGYRTQSRRLRRTLLLHGIFGLVVLPAGNLLLFLLSRGHHPRGGRGPLELIDFATYGMFAGILVLAFVWERRTLAASRSRGGPHPRDRIPALNNSAGLGAPLALWAFLTAQHVSWQWGAVLYAAVALFLLRVLLLWRRCEREAVP